MKSRTMIFCALAFTMINANASFIKVHSPIKIIPKVIYGVDERLDIYESSDSLMNEIAKSTAAQIMNSNLEQVGDLFNIVSNKLSDNGICSSERFSNQLIAASCSGFLISSDTLVTAGHCVESVSDCSNHSWVFDYANITEEKASFSFTKDQVYRCTKVVAREKNLDNMNDYAVVKLDRPVIGRTALKFRKSGKPANDAVFTVLGHPSGVPLKITPAADMRDNTDPIFFKINSDTYGGNSGSAVVDSRTGLVEGILVRGDQDYQKSDSDSCLVSVHRALDSGRGEDVTRITNIKALMNK